MKTKSKSPGVVFAGIAFLIVIVLAIKGCFALVNNNSNTTDAKSQPKSEPLDSQFETTWREPNDGDEAINISKVIAKNNIPCPILKVRASNSNNGSYLCACQQDVGQSWAIYQIWPELDTMQVAYEHVKTPPLNDK